VPALLKLALAQLGPPGRSAECLRCPRPGAAEDETELAVEGRCVPSLAEFVGQQKVRGQLQLLLDAARIQQRPPDHILLSGPPGLGKTTLAMIVAHESERPLRLSSGPAIQHAGDLAALLSSLVPGECSSSTRSTGWRARRGDALPRDGGFPHRHHGRQGRGATSIPLDLAPFTLVGATTRSGLLPEPAARPLRLHGAPGVLRTRSSSGRRALGSVLGVDVPPPRATRSRDARAAHRASRTVCCGACATTSSCTARGTRRPRARTTRALDLYDVDAIGLDRLDRAVLDAVVRRFRGGRSACRPSR
jgi:Holliday junction DNA helicase RuvB